MSIGLALAVPAHAQRASENAVTSSDDAFGINVGLESTGIYTDRNTRGFSPLEAGNVRIEGIYFDPVETLSGRLRDYTAIRVGFRAVGFPFVAPTGVVDNQFKKFPKEAGNSLTYNHYYYNGYIAEWDMRLPVVEDRVGLTGGFAVAETRMVDGATWRSWGVTLHPIIRVADFEFAPFVAAGEYTSTDPRPLAVVSKGYLPELPGPGEYLGQDWVHGRKLHQNWGATLKGKLTDSLSFRGGIFYSMGNKSRNFSEIYDIVGQAGEARHYVFADPAHDIHSTSGEALLGLRLGGEKIQHRIFGGYRARNRYTETGGSAFINITDDFKGGILATYGEPDEIDEPEFKTSAVNSGRVRQSSWMLGYIGHYRDTVHLNIGLQKARYRAISVDGGSDLRDVEKANPWLYNATLMVDVTPSISVYAATQRGLEDSGLAPGNAVNRDEQLPATKTTQYEGGVRWDFGRGQLVMAAFEISKPYFNFDDEGNFVQLGKRRHRGVEGSLTGHFGKRLDIVAGAVIMDPVVTGEGRDAALAGKQRPAGTSNLYAQIDANYRTRLFGGMIVTGGLHYTGKRAVTSGAAESLGDRQLKLPGWVSVDVGLRQRFKLGHMDASVRGIVKNLLDEKEWYVVAPNVLYPEDRRRFLGVVAVDF